MMGLAGGGARNAQRTLAGEGVTTILRVTSNVNLFKLASMRMVAAPHGLAAGPMAVFESVGIDADFFPEAADAQYLSSISETLWPGTVGVFRPRCGRITRKPRSVAPMGTQHHLQYVTEQIASLSLFKAVPNQRLQLIQVIRD
jgi:hypothetical protein